MSSALGSRLARCLVVAAVLWFGAIALLPVQFTAVVDRPPSVELIGDSAPPPVGLPRHGIVRITTLDENTTELVLPLVPGVGRMAPTAAHVVAGDWEPWANGPDRMVSSTAGSTLEIDGTYSVLEIGLITTPAGGRVEVGFEGLQSQIVDLRGTGDWVIVRLDFGRSVQNTGRRFLWSGHSVSFPEGDVAQALAAVGQISVEPTVVQRRDSTTVAISTSAAWRSVGASAASAAIVLLADALILAVLLLVGTISTRLLRPTTDSWAMRGALGLAVIALPIGMLNYALSVRLSAVILLVAGFAIWLVARRRPPVPRPGFGRRQLWAVVLTATGLGAVLTATRGFALGYLQTDVVDYLNMSGVLWDSSSTAAHSHFGNGLRLIDFSLRSLVDGALPLSARQALLAFTAATLLLMAVAVAELTRRLRLSGLAAAAVVSLAVGSGALTALWTEGYFSRHLFAVTLMLATAIVVGVVADNDMNPRTWVTIGLVLAVPLTIVPTFVVIGLPLLVLLLGYWRRHRERPLRAQPVAAFVVTLAAAALPNMIWLKDVEVTRRYAVAAADIGRYVVVPFHATARFPATLLGLLPFHDHQASPIGSDLTSSPVWPLRWFRDTIDTSAALPWVVAVVVIAMVVAVVASFVAGRGDKLQPTRKLLVSTLILTVVLGLAILRGWPVQAYTILMYYWTLAPVTLMMTALVIAAAPRQSGRRWGRIISHAVAPGLLVTLASVNLVSSTLDAGRWLEAPVSPLASRWNFEVVADAILLDEYLATNDPPSSFRLSQASGELTAGDSGRVLGNLLVLDLEDHGATCVNCVRQPANGSLIWGDLQKQPAEAVLVIGDTNCTTGDPAVQGSWFAICELDDPSS